MKSRPITKELLRLHFGSDAKISGWSGRYRVRTDTGGEVIITPEKITTVSGRDDVYRAVTLLAQYKWDTIKVRGSREFLIGAVLHAEANGVKVRVDHSKPGAAIMRALVCIGIVVGGLSISDPKNGGETLFILGIALVVASAMKRSAKREEVQKAEQLGFHYPRTQSATAASSDELKRKGWI